MIVRDEAAVIERCLASVRPFIDHWVIVDTGSVDDTRERIESALVGIPGELHRHPWKNFGHNRSEALNLAKDHGDYLLFIDADECLRAPDGFAWPALNGDAYYLNAEYGATLYSRCSLVSTRLEWKWSGVLHEFLESTPQARFGRLEWPRMVVQHDGARAHDPKTYEKDAAILERALREDPLNARNAFYLAQSWRDAGDPVKAIAAYRHRVTMAGFEEEAWYALFEIAKLAEQLGGSPAEVRSAYLDAYQRRPCRAEPLYKLAFYHRTRNELALAYLFAKQAAAIPRPNDLLFIDEGVYTWCCLDELATAAYWVGAYDEGRKVTERLLAEGHVPESHRARIEANLGHFQQQQLQDLAQSNAPPDPRKTVLDLASATTLKEAPNRTRIVASMTTIPSRIDLIRPVLEAVLAQSVPVEHVELNIPYQSIRTGESYSVPAWLEQMDRVKIFRTEDYGPITKVAPTFLRHQNDQETYVWSVDDDCAYPANQLQLLCRVHDRNKRRILTRYGGKLEADGTVSFWHGEAEVTMFEGFGGVLYPPACIRENFLEYLLVTSANSDCRKNDDIVLAMYFNACAMPIYLFNKVTEDTPYLVSGWLPHSKRDALSAQGHEENYKRIFNFISSPEVQSILAGMAPVIGSKSGSQSEQARHALNQSVACYQQGHYDDAINAARTALMLQPGYADAYNNLAAAYASKAMWDEAIQAAEQAIRFNPDLQIAKNNLAWAQAEKNKALGT